MSPTCKAVRSPRGSRRARFEVESLESRVVLYSASGNLWPSPQLVTISFMPDGTSLGGNPSTLMSAFNTKFGSTAAWQNVILRAAQVWAQQTNINFSVVPDSGTGIGTGTHQQGDPTFGDIRIGGYNYGYSTLASAFQPPPVNNFSVAGDFHLNTGQAFNINRIYDLFTVATHEVGHTLGLHHSSVYNSQMYANYNGIKTALATDDISGIRSIYGGARANDAYDAAASNGTTAAATDVSSLIDATALTALVTGLDITTTADLDYYKFVAPAGLSGTTNFQVVSQGLSLLSPLMTVYNAAGASLGTTSSTSYGATLSLNVGGLVAGQTYYVKVDGVDATAFGTGAYALTMNFGTGASPTVPLPNTQLLSASPLQGGGGEAIKVAGETLVNTYTAGAQETSDASPGSVAMDGDGNYVVTWSSKGQDGDGRGIYAQRYDASGEKRGGEIRVNTATDGDQANPSVAIGVSGDFVITWSSFGQDARKSWGVYAQRFDAAGGEDGGEFRVNSSTEDDQRYSSVAMDKVGNIFITWSSNRRGNTGWGIFGRQFRADGGALGEEMRIETSSLKDQSHSTVVVDDHGHAVVVWSGHGAADKGGVFMQRFELTHTARVDGFTACLGTAGDDHDHDLDAWGQQSRTQFAEPDLDLISDVAAAIASRDSRRNQERSPDRQGSTRWSGGQRIEGHQ